MSVSVQTWPGLSLNYDYSFEFLQGLEAFLCDSDRKWMSDTLTGQVDCLVEGWHHYFSVPFWGYCLKPRPWKRYVFPIFSQWSHRWSSCPLGSTIRYLAQPITHQSRWLFSYIRLWAKTKQTPQLKSNWYPTHENIAIYIYVCVYIYMY